MIVRLTKRQLDRVRVHVSHAERSERLVEWLSRDVVDASDQRRDVWMPAIGWLRIEQIMFDYCYDARGYRGKNVRDSDLKALKQMRSAINLREHHPALSMIGAVGLIRELIPAWRLHIPLVDGRSYSPYPSVEGSFVVLVPEMKINGAQFTYWQEGHRASELPLLDEREHWALQ